MIKSWDGGRKIKLEVFYNFMDDKILEKDVFILAKDTFLKY